MSFSFFLWNTASYFFGALVCPSAIWRTSVTSFLTAYQNSQSTINTTLLQEKQWLIHKSLLSQQTVAEGRKKKCVWRANTYHSHTHTHTHRLAGLQARTLQIRACIWHTNPHSHARAQTPARTGSRARADTNTRIQTHPREGYSKWTPQPSKALTSIRHAYTVRLPTDSESHLSARASAKQFQSEGNHFMHICIHRSERAKLVGSLPNLPYSCCLLQLCKLWNDLFTLNDSF